MNARQRIMHIAHFAVSVAVFFAVTTCANAQVFTVFINSASVCVTRDESRLWPANHVMWYTKSKIRDLNPSHSYATFYHDHQAQIRGGSCVTGSLNYYRTSTVERQGQPGRPLRKGETLDDRSKTNRSLLCNNSDYYKARSYGSLNKTLIWSDPVSACVPSICTY